MKTTLLTVAIMVMAVVASGHQHHQPSSAHIRSKRGITDFFRRFWTGRKKPNYQSQSPVYPLYSQDYLYGQASNMYPIYQYGANMQQQLQSQAQQIFAAAAAAEQQSNGANSASPYYGGGGGGGASGGWSQQSPTQQQQVAPIQNQLQQQQQQQQQYMNQASYGNGGGYSQMQAEESNSNGGQYGQYQQGQYMQTPQQSQQQQQQQQGAAQAYMGQASNPIGTYTSSVAANTAQANTFHSRPYGLSPHGDHENAKTADQAYAESETKPVFTFKKLYSYPFYMSSTGDKQTAYHGSSIRRQSNEDLLMNVALKNNLLASQKMDIDSKAPVASASVANTPGDDEKSFIAKNAAALQEFLSNKVNGANSGGNSLTKTE